MSFGIPQQQTLIGHHWDQIERHPRLVFDQMDATTAEIVKWQLAQGKPFTVVMR